MERIVPYEKRRNYLCQDFNRHRASALMALILFSGAGSGLFHRCKRYQRQYTCN